MNRLSVIALVAAVGLAASLWTPVPAAAQTPVQRGKTLDVLLFSTSGATTMSFGITYPFSFILDGTLNYQTAGGTSVVDVGARYWFPVRPAGFSPYVGGGLIFATSTGFYLGGGASVALEGPWNGYVGLNLRSVGGTSVTAFDVGAQYIFGRYVGGVIGLAGSGGTSSIYVGATFNY
ncbi:MAG TPA: hypothetical protein VFV60_04595 [bacterium]|nr:hypothetical protein [bacterium]